ncbi:type I-B CRISPR-associated protein Cas7/Csh2 [Kosmotoga olearia]|uniref:CRISPR-associated protein, Csh2 family n=1 Tax=Kosmotoga olearia (strain ATCC BAA-1733 / DSM 21960 / TBF 19.5.1) TaxID=521045 RepID=C5CFB2_KOSOT|nr:type I-B CRISPR-associated protein Cas7/Csh2 [Kosmotoga olearia]ACR79389.1 CRISPR-associated protein, Csh2 family [Kosmotoga olearia TBF 19.5.1]
MEFIKNRHEIVFVYDVKDGNPNGDPLDENKPRMDEVTGVNIVSDVRLKKTCREYMISANKEKDEYEFEVFINGDPVTSEQRAKQLIPDITSKEYDRKTAAEALLKKCIDLRLFGGTVPISKLNMSMIGPVQFRFGRSLHKVDPVFIQGTAAFASKEDREGRSFSEKWQLPYSCIAFYGVINQNTAKETLLREVDIDFFFEALWNGTRDLITRSKMEQLPRLLIDVVYNDNENFHIGELDKAIKLVSDLLDEKIRGISDFVLEVSELKGLLERYNDKIKEIRYRIDPRLKLTLNGEPFKIENLIDGKMKPLAK